MRAVRAVQQNEKLHVDMFNYISTIRYYTVKWSQYQLSKNQTCHQPLEVYPLHHGMLNLIKYSHVAGSNLTQRFWFVSSCPLCKWQIYGALKIGTTINSIPYNVRMTSCLQSFPFASIAPPIRPVLAFGNSKSTSYLAGQPQISKYRMM